jgi:hydrogenase maturation protein HypF
MKIYEYKISGIVQGVGFRPYIFRVAKENNLKGYVKNMGSFVLVVVNHDDFGKLLMHLPPLASINSINKKEVLLDEVSDFYIQKSSAKSNTFDFPPDIFTCKDCINELKDKKNRRYNYYFVTCTNCGPRFSMLKALPYDRDKTTMGEFVMCEECKKEYTNPLDRRYHAQTIACPNCGPELKLLINKKEYGNVSDIEKIKKTVELLKENKWVSIKGVGGYHIVSRLNSEVVGRVRSFFNRPNKPFAVMVKDETMLNSSFKYNDFEFKILNSPERPIVVIQKRNFKEYSFVSELDSVGVMFAYTSLHYLLLDIIGEPLIMTSANMPGEPVVLNKGIGDIELSHTREIYNRVDDSVIKVINNNAVLLRRSRGYVPKTINVKQNLKKGIALGAEENNTFAFSLGNENINKILMSQHIGNTEKLNSFEFQKKAVERFLEITKLKPDFIATDMHPLFNTTKFGEELAEKFNCENIKVQHHKAHIASVAGEHNLTNYVGIACDGTGYGEDGTVWGGEVFLVRDGKFERVGHIEKIALLGGDSATKNPSKILFAWLCNFLNKKELIDLNIFDKKETLLYINQLEKEFNVIKTSSTGRFLDAISVMLGVCDANDYEGRCAMLLENFISENYNSNEILKARIKSGKYLDREIDILEISFLFEKYKKIIYDRFKYKKEISTHIKTQIIKECKLYIANGLFSIAKKYNLPVVFSGGVAYNKLITRFMMDNGVFINKAVPCGDGGVSFGQIIYASNL